MKKLIICFILIAFNSIAVSANEKDYSEMEHNDYTEEIEMFQRYYDNPESYVFQDQEGNDIGDFVWSQRELFKKDPYHTTDAMMEVVCSVQEDTPFISFYSANTVTWSRQKICTKKNIIGLFNSKRNTNYSPLFTTTFYSIFQSII